MLLFFSGQISTIRIKVRNEVDTPPVTQTSLAIFLPLPLPTLCHVLTTSPLDYVMMPHKVACSLFVPRLIPHMVSSYLSQSRDVIGSLPRTPSRWLSRSGPSPAASAGV